MKSLAAFATLMIFASGVSWAVPDNHNPLRDYSACTARAALRFDDGRRDFAPIARAVAATRRDSYRIYVRYMDRAHLAEHVQSDRDLAISAVQYERKYGPAPLAARRPQH